MKIKWYKNSSVIRNIIFIVVNILAIILFFYAGMEYTQGHIDDSIIITLVGELIFLVLSLVVYYLSIIASAVCKIADSTIEDSEKKN